MTKKEENKKERVDLSEMADKWPSTIVARRKVEAFTGGMLTGRYMANLDSDGKGLPSIRMGRRNVAYGI